MITLKDFHFPKETHEISVKITDVKNPPANASSKNYELIEIIKQDSTNHFPYNNTCAPEYVPMCGVDGITYGNSCMINFEHIAVKHRGECQ